MTKKTYRIINVISKRNGIEIQLGEQKFLLNTNDYLDGYYYPEKELSSEEYQNLKKMAKNKKAKDYLTRLLSSHMYTKKELTDKLSIRFSLTQEEIQYLLHPFEESDIISDIRYANEYCQAKLEQGHGRRYILEELKKKGISKEILSSLPPMSEQEEEILPSLIQRMDKARSSSTIEKRKEDILISLIRRGYDSSIARKAIENYYSSLSDEKKMEEDEKRRVLLKKEADRCYNSLSRKNWPAAKRKDSFRKKLMVKGFRHDEIDEIIKEYSIHD